MQQCIFLLCWTNGTVRGIDTVQSLYPRYLKYQLQNLPVLLSFHRAPKTHNCKKCQKFVKSFFTFKKIVTKANARDNALFASKIIFLTVLQRSRKISKINIKFEIALFLQLYSIIKNFKISHHFFVSEANCNFFGFQSTVRLSSNFVIQSWYFFLKTGKQV